MRKIAAEALRLQREASKCTAAAGKYDTNNAHMAGLLDGKAQVYREWSQSLRAQAD